MHGLTGIKRAATVWFFFGVFLYYYYWYKYYHITIKCL